MTTSSAEERAQRTHWGHPAVPTPPALLETARQIPGWAFCNAHTTFERGVNQYRTQIRLDHRGGVVVPPSRFRCDLPGWQIIHVQSHVARGKALITIRMRRI